MFSVTFLNIESLFILTVLIFLSASFIIYVMMFVFLYTLNFILVMSHIFLFMCMSCNLSSGTWHCEFMLLVDRFWLFF